MSNYVQKIQKHRRLTILRFLAEAPEYTSNVSILTDICNDYGVTSTRSQVSGDVNWMAENAMVIAVTEHDFTVVTATQRGLEIASGLAVDEGVKRPRPGV